MSQSLFPQLEVMSYGVVRQWVLRLGYGLLVQELEVRSDWIYIIDHSITLGRERCFLILGVTQASLETSGYALKHHQVRVIDISVSRQYDPQDVYERLVLSSARTGVPCQIISDQGSDLKQGVTQFLSQHSWAIWTHDLSHKIGTYLKKTLEKDPQWILLGEDLRSLTHQIKQSTLSFLRPITLSVKSRWLNIDKLLDSLRQIYTYAQQEDFSLISQEYILENPEKLLTFLAKNQPRINPTKKLQKQLKTQTFATPEQGQEYLAALFPSATQELDQLQWAAAGKILFEQKFACLDKHRAFVAQLTQLNQMLQQIKTLIKTQGLSLDTLEKIDAYQPRFAPVWIVKLFREVVNFLVEEHHKRGPDPTPMLLCSDVIESIFGKFKAKLSQGVGGIYDTVLIIPLFCQELSHLQIQQILQRVPFKDVQQWGHNNRGVSNLAKRRRAFDSS